MIKRAWTNVYDFNSLLVWVTMYHKSIFTTEKLIIA